MSAKIQQAMEILAARTASDVQNEEVEACGSSIRQVTLALAIRTIARFVAARVVFGIVLRSSVAERLIADAITGLTSARCMRASIVLTRGSCYRR